MNEYYPKWVINTLTGLGILSLLKFFRNNPVIAISLLALIPLVALISFWMRKKWFAIEGRRMHFKYTLLTIIGGLAFILFVYYQGSERQIGHALGVNVSYEPSTDDFGRPSSVAEYDGSSGDIAMLRGVQWGGIMLIVFSSWATYNLTTKICKYRPKKKFEFTEHQKKILSELDKKYPL